MLYWMAKQPEWQPIGLVLDMSRIPCPFEINQAETQKSCTWAVAKSRHHLEWGCVNKTGVQERDKYRWMRPQPPWHGLSVKNARKTLWLPYREWVMTTSLWLEAITSQSKKLSFQSDHHRGNLEALDKQKKPRWKASFGPFISSIFL